MKKILYVTNTSYTLFSLRLNLMKSMKNEGYTVYAGAPEDKNSTLFDEHGIRFFNVPMSQFGINILEEIRTIFYFLRVFSKIKPDIIHLFSVKPIIWGGVAGIFFPSYKIVSTITGMGILKSGSKVLRAALFYVIRISHRENKEYIFQNQHDLEYFEEHTGIKGCSHLIRGSGVNTKFFKIDGKTGGKRVFLMFSRMLSRKGVFEYLAAVRNLSDALLNKAEFLLLGGAYPSNPNHIDDEWLSGSDAIDPAVLLSKTSESNVKWLEHDNNVMKYLRESDVVVLPSYHPEGLPRSLLEAMSCENAVITTKTPGCEDVVDGSNGFLVEPRNVEQLRECVEEVILMSDRELQHMKRRSRNLVIEKFSDDVVISKCKEIYREL